MPERHSYVEETDCSQRTRHFWRIFFATVIALVGMVFSCYIYIGSVSSRLSDRNRIIELNLQKTTTELIAQVKASAVSDVYQREMLATARKQLDALQRLVDEQAKVIQEIRETLIKIERNGTTASRVRAGLLERQG